MEKQAPKKFAIPEFKREADPTRDVRTLQVKHERDVQEFKLPSLNEKGKGDYAVTRAKFGPLAMTDRGRDGRAVKDSQFHLTELAKKPLAVEEEERRFVEQKVEERLAAIRDDALAKGIKLGIIEGEKKGYQDAFRKFSKECESKVVNFDKLLDAMENAKSDIYRKNETFLVELVFRIAKMLLLKELAVDKGYVSRLATEIIEKIGTRENVKIRVNPMDLLMIGNLKDDIEAKIGSLKNFSVEASSQVGKGGCLVETEFNAVDAGIETQLAAIYSALLGTP